MTRNRKIIWCSELSYGVGLFVADGSMSKDGRHLDFTSKDCAQIQNFIRCFDLRAPIKPKSSGSASQNKKYYHVQFSDVGLYRFLNNIGITNNKSLTIKEVLVPDKFFNDFLRGLLDGDGSISILKHPESKLLQAKMRFASGSITFLQWLHKKIQRLTDITSGHIAEATGCHQLVYGKADSIILVHYMYDNSTVYLQRKREMADRLVNLH